MQHGRKVAVSESPLFYISRNFGLMKQGSRIETPVDRGRKGTQAAQKLAIRRCEDNELYSVHYFH